MVAHLATLRPRIERLAAQAAPIPLRDVALRSPVANPGKIIAAPVNYQTHLQEVRGDPQLHHGNPSHTLTIHTAGVFLKRAARLPAPVMGSPSVSRTAGPITKWSRRA